jgi:AbrB family looped-hinge helix DNA binding protein
MSTVTVSKKGWIVIPREIRKRYNIRPGDKIQVVDYGGSIAIAPAVEDPIGKLFGMFKGGPSLTKALLEERRRELEREERDLERWGAGGRKPE